MFFLFHLSKTVDQPVLLLPRSLRFFAIRMALFLSVWGFAAHALPAEPAGVSPEDAEFFEARVRPLLAGKCFNCHGEGAKLEGSLRLTSRGDLMAGGDSGPAVSAGDPAASLLLQVIAYTGDIQMPPDGKLTQSEIETLSTWVQKGLPWPGDHTVTDAARLKPAGFTISDEQRAFWAFQPLRVSNPPVVHQAGRLPCDIDRYILAGMESNGLSPAEPADKRVLVRRATFDLIGLPPTPQEIDLFLADDSPRAFSRVVDRLLASPRYGERWGRYWLDVVRYADSRDLRSFGIPSDISEAWRYRDWVVKAFNSDLPFNQFIIQQLAGDLLPPPNGEELNFDGLVATGLLTVGEWGYGDADKEKMVTDLVDDQINVVSKAFMGLTVSCARCHDHKFDPISHRDYYALAGIFFSTHIIPDPGVKGGETFMLHTPLLSEAQLAERKAEEKQVAHLQQARENEVRAEYAALAERMLPQTSAYLMALWDAGALNNTEPLLTPVLEELASVRQLDARVLKRWSDWIRSGDERLFDRPFSDVTNTPGLIAWRREADLPVMLVNTTNGPIRKTTLTLPGKSVSLHPSPTVGAAISWKNPGASCVHVRGRISDADASCGNGVEWRLELVSRGHIRVLAKGSITNGASQSFTDVANAADLAAVTLQGDDAIRIAILANEDYYCDTTIVELAIGEVGGSEKSWSLADDIVPGQSNDGLMNPHIDRYGHAAVWSFHEFRARSGYPDIPAGSTLEAWLNMARTSAVGNVPRDTVIAAADVLNRALVTPLPEGGADAQLQVKLLGSESPYWLRNNDLQDLPLAARTAISTIDQQLVEIKERLNQPIPLAIAAQEGGVPGTPYAGIHDARIHIRGSYTRLGEEVPRRFPQILAGDEQSAISNGSGRLQLAEWLASSNHPLTARVMANRLWQYHFGQGLVRTPNNFGQLGERPTHPLLLDYLASELISSGWSMKAMHRTIMLSATYQQASRPTAAAIERDPDNRWLSHFGRRRLEAEALRDSLLAVAGKLEETMGGPSVRDFNTPRRTMYLTTIRSDRSGFGPLFDVADSMTPTDVRSQSTVAPQALFLLNHPFVIEQSRVVADRVRAQTSDERRRIRTLYELLFGRVPTRDEFDIGVAFVKPADGNNSTADAWQAYCQILLCSNEFMYFD